MKLAPFLASLMSRLGALLLTCALAGCVSGAPPRDAVAQLPAPDSATATGSDGNAEYRVSAQDLLEISVFGVPDLSRSVRVNSNGVVSLPLIGNVQAGGLTIGELEQSLATRLSEAYLQNPQVSVFVRETTSQRVTLEGSLKNPGVFPISGRTTLLQVVALAGGLDPLADPGGIVVFRQVAGKRMAAVYDVGKIRSGVTEDPQVFGGDVVVVEQSGSRTAVRRIIELAPALALFILL